MAQLIQRIQDDIIRETEENDDMLNGPMPGAAGGSGRGMGPEAMMMQMLMSNPAMLQALLMGGSGGGGGRGGGGHHGGGPFEYDSDEEDEDEDEDEEGIPYFGMGMGGGGGGRSGPFPEEVKASQDAELEVKTNAKLSKEAHARFKAFFGVDTVKGPQYVDTKAAWHWTDNPEPIPSHLDNDKSFDLLEFAENILVSSTKFTSSGDMTVQPVLSIKGLQVSPEITEWPVKDLLTRIYEMATDSPFGKGTKTVIDKSVRSCRQLDPSQFEIKNAEFNTLYGSDSVQSPLLERIRKDLAPSCSKIRSELYKMLIYKGGDFFKEHRDTQRGSDMFATLVVCPPVEGEGGRLTVSHNGDKQQFDLSEEGGYAAFFADCLHEVSKVYSGHRISFVYNLMRDGPETGPDPAAADLARLFDLISQVLQLEKGRVCVGHLLEHKYALSLLTGPQALKGRDAQLFQLASARPDMEILITPVEILVNGHAGYDEGRFGREELDDEDDEYIAVRTWAIDPGVSRKGSAGQINYSVLSNKCLQELGVAFIQDESNQAVQVGSDFHPSGNEGTTAAFTYVHGAMIFKLKKDNAAKPAAAKRAGGGKKKR